MEQGETSTCPKSDPCQSKISDKSFTMPFNHSPGNFFKLLARYKYLNLNGTYLYGGWERVGFGTENFPVQGKRVYTFFFSVKLISDVFMTCFEEDQALKESLLFCFE